MAVASKLLKDAVLFCSMSHSPYTQRRELEYDKFLNYKMIVAKNKFRALLRETKKIAYRLVGSISRKRDWDISEIEEGKDVCVHGIFHC